MAATLPLPPLAAAPPPELRPVVPAPKPAARVLVAEADPLYRQVLVRLLESLEYAVDVADSDIAAVAAFERRHYDLVILDCDTAGARGFETAARLRRLESPQNRVPIVAVTVNADPEHRKQRKAAGFDNYIAKPLLRENVISVLARCLPSTDAVESPRYLALDRHRLQELDSLAGDRPELLPEWIGLFLSSAPLMLERLRAAVEDGDAAALRVAASDLRSRGGQIGALRVQEICGIISALAAGPSLAGVEALLPQLSLAYERAARELRAVETETRGGRRVAPLSPAARRPRAFAANRILLAEADPLMARFLLNNLSSAGFAVTQAAGGIAAIDSARSTEFAAVILDLEIPEVDGYTVLSELRARPGWASPVMIVSARHQEQDILRAFELGADDYVTIPFSPMEVVARVRRLVKQGAHIA